MIDRGIPLPPIPRPQKRHFADKLKVGESYFVVCGFESMRKGIYAGKEVTGGRYSYRTVTENEVRGYRVWRIE